jgi:hypothetical protein
VRVHIAACVAIPCKVIRAGDAEEYVLIGTGERCNNADGSRTARRSTR